MGKHKANRIGETKYNNHGEKITIIEYKNASCIDVLFEDYNYVEVNREYKEFKNGKINCPYTKKVYGVGFVGENFKNMENKTKCYSTWHSMMTRAYSDDYKEKHSTYKDVSVCEEWHDYSNFKEWYYENYYEIEGEKICLDKDILYKNNKIYSPKTCIFAPIKINNLFTKNNAIRGDLPIGVNRIGNRYQARINADNKRISEFFDTPKDAFIFYKIEKEKEIKRVANIYKNKIPLILYRAMMNYEVDIND